MKKILLFLIIITCFSISTKAQEYKTAVGIRLGPNSAAIAPGFTVKHFLNEKHAVEGIIGFKDGVGICGLYEWYHPVNSVEHMQWFIGAGGYAAYRTKTAYIGGAGIVGLDYKFPEIPLNISIDWKPELNIVETVGFEASGVGFSARFTF
jgi:hypothetical protein